MLQSKKEIAKKIATKCIGDLKIKTDAVEKRQMLTDAWTQLCAAGCETFYIDHPLSSEALTLYEYAKEVSDSKIKGNYPNGAMYKALMPTIKDYRNATWDDLAKPNKLIISDGYNLIEPATEIIAERKSNGEQHYVHPYDATRPFSKKEMEQLKVKNPDLYQKIEASSQQGWLSPKTLLKLIYVLNVTLSKGVNPDQGLDGSPSMLERFRAALLKNPDLAAYDYESFREKAKLESPDSVEDDFALGYMFIYFRRYLDTLPEIERQAFFQIEHRGFTLIGEVSQVHLDQCLTTASEHLASFVYEASTSERGMAENFKYHALNSWNNWKLGSCSQFVKSSTSPKRWLLSTLLSLGTFPLMQLFNWIARKSVSLLITFPKTKLANPPNPVFYFFRFFYRLLDELERFILAFLQPIKTATALYELKQNKSLALFFLIMVPSFAALFIFATPILNSSGILGAMDTLMSGWSLSSLPIFGPMGSFFASSLQPLLNSMHISINMQLSAEAMTLASMVVLSGIAEAIYEGIQQSNSYFRSSQNLPKTTTNPLPLTPNQDTQIHAAETKTSSPYLHSSFQPNNSNSNPSTVYPNSPYDPIQLNPQYNSSSLFYQQPTPNPPNDESDNDSTGAGLGDLGPSNSPNNSWSSDDEY